MNETPPVNFDMHDLLDDVAIVRDIADRKGVSYVLTCLHDVLIERWNHTVVKETMSQLQHQMEVIKQANERL